MAYVSQFPSADNVLVRPRGGLRLAARLSSFARRIRDYIDMMADFYVAAALHDELSKLSDAELYRRGLSRENLARHVDAARSRVANSD
jgi:hypothetical protein